MLKRYGSSIIVGLLVVSLAAWMVFIARSGNQREKAASSEKTATKMAPGERAKIKGMDFTISGFPNNRTVHIVATQAVAKDAKVMPYIRTSLKQMVHLRKVSVKSMCEDKTELEVVAKRGKYDPSKQKLELSGIQTAKCFDKTLQVSKLSLLMDTKLEDVRISTGPFSVVDASKQPIRQGKKFSGFLHELL